MKRSLDELPKERQAELKQITDCMVKQVSPEMVILFGSYATGRWVADKYVSGHITYEYQSDFDILVLTGKGEKREEHQVQEMLETKCQQLTPVPLNVIVHSIDYVNKRIAEGQYFFTDIKKEGILLYDAGKIPLAELKELTGEEKKTIVEREFNNHFESAVDLLSKAIIYNKDKPVSLKNAVFLLHQVTEKLYGVMILVLTGYKPKTHNLNKLMRMSREFSPELITVFPNNSPKETHLFNLLKKAYVDARYNESYVITEEELKTLIDRVKRLQEIAERVCREKIETF